MCNTCGASCPRHVINTHIHRHTSCLCQALGHRRYNNDGNSTFTPVSLSGNKFHLLATFRHHFNVWCLWCIMSDAHCQSTLCLRQALGHRRYDNNGNSTFTPVSLLVNNFHPLATFRHHFNVWCLWCIISDACCQSTLCLRQALGHRRYDNDGNSTFTPVSSLVNNFHLLATFRHHFNVWCLWCIMSDAHCQSTHAPP